MRRFPLVIGRRFLAALLTLGVVTWAQPGLADDPQAEAEVRRVLTIIGNMNLSDPTTKRRIETVLADEALIQLRQGHFLQFRSEPDAVRIFEDYAVARFQRNGAITHDVYVYLRHDPVWRLVAFRTMARTGMLIQMKQYLESIWFRTPEQQAQYENVRLTLSTDRELHRWFDQHRSQLDSLVQDYRKAVTAGATPTPSTPPGESEPPPGYLTDDPVPTPAPMKALTAEQQAAASDIAARVQALHLTGVDVLSEEEVPGRDDQAAIRVIIGGILDDSVNFVHAPAGAPQLAPNQNIWVEPLGKDWYLVRTT